MKIFSAEKIREIDAYTIENEPIASVDLMERASAALFQRIRKMYQPDTRFIIFAGPGNNGGDGLALARMLHGEGFEVETYLVAKIGKLSEDCRINYERLHIIDAKHLTILKEEEDIPKLAADVVVVDALFGSGLSRPLDRLYSSLVKEINASACEVVSVDVPSGMFCEDNAGNNRETIVRATHTISFQFAKLAFMFAENELYVGEWHIEDIGLHQSIIMDSESDYRLLDSSIIREIYRKRARFSHKGTFGHALMIAGSYCKMGAAVLASRACLKSGVGLLTTHSPRLGYEILQTAVPEAMLCMDRSDILVSEFPKLNGFKAIGIGPGIGTKPNTESLVHDLLEKSDLPMVIDADGINVLSNHPDWLLLLKPGTILTPHPGEFSRLAGPSKDDFEQLQKAKEFAIAHKVVVVLKGANTLIVNQTGECLFNQTGNSGMATAGSGDVLTGIITALLAQGYAPMHAAILAVWCHGLAGDIYVETNGGEALTASELINKLGESFFRISKY